MQKEKTNPASGQRAPGANPTQGPPNPSQVFLECLELCFFRNQEETLGLAQISRQTSQTSPQKESHDSACPSSDSSRNSPLSWCSRAYKERRSLTARTLQPLEAPPWQHSPKLARTLHARLRPPNKPEIFRVCSNTCRFVGVLHLSNPQLTIDCVHRLLATM